MSISKNKRSIKISLDATVLETLEGIAKTAKCTKSDIIETLILSLVLESSSNQSLDFKEKLS